jgi:tRNA nucleotidyltransferase/poly(A) polymerase
MSRIKVDVPIPEDIRGIKDVFVKNGHKLYVVGGAVRDALLGKQPKDYDLATDATPDKVEAMMQRAGLKTLPTGKAFGVINVFTDADEYEIATFREDIGSGRRPDAVKFTDIESDVKRRDLTINALFYDIDTGEVVDLVGGVDDLKKGIVRTVGAPEDRFGEDRLRILRAVRFAARFGSNLDPAVDAALKKDANLDGISPERIRDEFLKGLRTAKSVKHFMQIITKYDLWEWIFRGVGDVNIKPLEERDPAVLMAWMLAPNDPTKLGKDLNKLTYTNDETKAVTFLVALLKFSPDKVVTFKKMQKQAGLSDEQIRKFASMVNLDQKLIEAFLQFQLSVTGKDAMDAGIDKGPEIGKFINQREIENFKSLL